MTISYHLLIKIFVQYINTLIAIVVLSFVTLNIYLKLHHHNGGHVLLNTETDFFFFNTNV